MSTDLMKSERPEKTRCKAKSKQSGKQCGNWPLPGMDVCRLHGGRAKQVQAKAAAAAQWVKHATDHALQVGGKPWKCLLIPHVEVVESKRLSDFLRFECKAGT